MKHQERAGALADAALAMQTSRGETSTLLAAVEQALVIVPGCTAAGLFESVRGQVRTTAATSDLVRRGDQLQLQYGEGPCLTALVGQQLVLSHDLAVEQRWIGWSWAAYNELGLRSMLSVRLYAGSGGHGSLNLYSTDPDAFDEYDQAAAITLAAQISAALAAARRDDQLTASVASRTLIGQAQGILMERLGIDATQAFDVLVEASQRSNVKLFKVAEQLVAMRGKPDASALPTRQR